MSSARSLRLLCACFFVLLSWSSGLQAHPHEKDTIMVFTGTLDRVDLKTQTIELDTIDADTRQARNVLMFVDRKAKLRQGKKRIALADLTVGRRAVCTAERDVHDDSRLVVFDIRME